MYAEQWEDVEEVVGERVDREQQEKILADASLSLNNTAGNQRHHPAFDHDQYLSSTARFVVTGLESNIKLVETNLKHLEEKKEGFEVIQELIERKFGADLAGL